jgi:hypothetical protein
MKEKSLLNLDFDKEPMYENTFKHHLTYISIVQCAKFLRHEMGENIDISDLKFRSFGQSFHRICLSLPCFPEN